MSEYQLKVLGADVGSRAAKEWLEYVRDQFLSRLVRDLPPRHVKSHGRKSPVDAYLSYWNGEGGRITLVVRRNADEEHASVYIGEVAFRRATEVETRYRLADAATAVLDYATRLAATGPLRSSP